MSPRCVGEVPTGVNLKGTPEKAHSLRGATMTRARLKHNLNRSLAARDEKTQVPRWVLSFLRPLLALQLCVVERQSPSKLVARRIDAYHAVPSVSLPHLSLGVGWVGMKVPASAVASDVRWLGARTLHDVLFKVAPHSRNVLHDGKTNFPVAGS